MAKATTKKKVIPVEPVEPEEEFDELDESSEPEKDNFEDKRPEFVNIVVKHFDEYTRYFRTPQDKAMYLRKIKEYAARAFDDVVTLFTGQDADEDDE